MFDAVGLVTISLGSVILDRPDQTGRFFAKDMAGGWAYLVGDADGDDRCRGHGVCEGGLDLTLRCAFLSAIARVPRCSRITVIVGTREAHRLMVRLAVKDPRVIKAIAGKPLSVMTRPEERTLRHVHVLAERAASGALRAREYAELQANPEAARPEGAAPAQASAAPPPARQLATIADWRSRLANSEPAPVRTLRRGERQGPAGHGIRGLFDPLLKGARQGLAAAGIMPAARPRRDGAIDLWLRELDAHVADISCDLRDAGT